MGEDSNDHLDPRYKIRTPDLLGLNSRLLRKLERSYDTVIRYLMVKDLQLKPEAMGKQGTRWAYQTELGTVHITEDDNIGRTFIVLVDTTLPRSELKAGHLALDILRTIQERVWAPHYIEVYYIRKNKRPRAIADLVEVNIDARLGAKRTVILEDAIPLHYASRKKVTESDDLIASLEREAVTSLNATGQGQKYPATVETTIANVWHESHGVLPGFMADEQKTPRRLSTRLYRRASLTPEPDARHTGTSPRSGGAQSP